MILILAAAQALAAPSPLMVFFDSGGTEIRREWEPVLDDAARAAASGVRIELVGHSDRPGSPAVNRMMGLKRAEAVAAALAVRGIPRSAITLRSTGEDDPLVPTADGVREIQNRRVDILLQR